MFKIFTDKRQIEYLDVDKDNKLTNTAIINMMQDVAGGHSESINDGLNDKKTNGTAWLILNWKIEVLSRPKYKDIITINTWARKIEKCFSLRDYEIYCNNILIAKATSKWVLVNANTARIVRVPEKTIEKYEPNGKSVFEEEMEEKLKEPENSILTYEETVGRTKIDTNNHLNNVYYLNFAIESLPEEVYENEELNNIEIMYKRASKYKENLKCYYGKESNKHVVTIKDEEGNIHAVIKMW